MEREHIALGASAISAERPLGWLATSSLALILALSAGPTRASDLDAIPIALASVGPPDVQSVRNPPPLVERLGTPRNGAWQAAQRRSLATIAESERVSRGVLGYPLAVNRPGGDGPFKLELPLNLQVTADFVGSVSPDRYSSGTGGANPPDLHALDWTLEANVGLSRRITKRTRIELGWRVIRNRSNFAVYDYDLSIWGIYFRTQLD